MSNQKYRECIIDTILSHRQNQNGRYEFLIKWKKAKPTWEPLQNLASIIELVEKYLQNKQIIKYETWNKSQTKLQFQENSCQKNNLINEEIQDEDTRESLIKKRKRKQQKGKNEIKMVQNNYVINYDEFFQRSNQNPFNRYHKKITSDERQKKCFIPKDKIQWKNIKRAIDIRFEQVKKKWMVEVQFYGGQGDVQYVGKERAVQLYDIQTKQSKQSKKIWIERDILRLVNPFVLLDLYTRIQRKNIQNKARQDGHVIQIQQSMDKDSKWKQKQRLLQLQPNIIEID